MTYRSRALSVATAFLLLLSTMAIAPTAAAQEDNEFVVHFVIDVSGSMNGPNLVEAVAALKEVARDLPDTTAIGLRSYGGSNCDQSGVPLRVPFGTGNDDAVIAAADALRAGGSTPTTGALDQAIDELIAFGAKGPNRIVLLTDGDNGCPGSICDFIRNKDLGGVEVELFTVGLQVSDAARGDLSCAAGERGGEFIAATEPAELADALKRSGTTTTTTTTSTTSTTTTIAGPDTTAPTTTMPAPVSPGTTVPGAAVSFETHLFPQNEVPPASGSGHAWSTWSVSDDGESIAYRITYSGLGEVTGAHLHQAGPSRNGPVVVPLDTSGAGNGTGTIEGTFSAADFAGPMQGRLMAGMVGAIKSGSIYVNVHTADQPAGAIRGQLVGGSGASGGGSGSGDLDVFVAGAPVDPTGRTPSARTDFVIGFADFDPDVPGIGLKAGGTIKVTLPMSFIDKTNRPVVASGTPGCAPPLVQGCSTAVVLQGWPQSVVPPFPDVSHDPSTNTFTVTAMADWPANGPGGPGAKAVHLIALGFRNPSQVGEYEVDVEIQPDPSSSRTLRGSGLAAIGHTKPVAGPIGLNAGSPPPPFPNTLHQQMTAGSLSLPMTFYLWDRSVRPIVGARLEMTNAQLATIFDANQQAIGTISISAPAGASRHTLLAFGPSEQVSAFVTGIPVGQLIMTFYAPSNARGEYELTVSLDGAEPVVHSINVVAP